jgi:hypothetical protein
MKARKHETSELRIETVEERIAPTTALGQLGHEGRPGNQGGQ